MNISVDQRPSEEMFIHKANISIFAFMEPQNSFLHLYLPTLVPSTYSTESNPLRGTMFKLSIEVLFEISEKKSVLLKSWRVTSEEF
jgi:hypothetical protein